MQYNAAPAPTPVTEARRACRELMALLAEENGTLPKHDVSAVEARTQQKKRLTLQLEQHLAELKRQGGLWREGAMRAEVAALAEEVKHFQGLARANASMLRAAHQIRADLIIAIRNELEAAQPRAQVYTSRGTVENAGGGAGLVTRSI